jgi:hypothetical protein
MLHLSVGSKEVVMRHIMWCFAFSKCRKTFFSASYILSRSSKSYEIVKHLKISLSLSLSLSLSFTHTHTHKHTNKNKKTQNEAGQWWSTPLIPAFGRQRKEATSTSTKLHLLIVPLPMDLW